MQLYNIIVKLLPGDLETGVNSFSYKMYTKLRREQLTLISDLEKDLVSFCKNYHKLPTCSELSINFINWLRKTKVDDYRKFRMAVLNVYLTSDEHMVTPVVAPTKRAKSMLEEIDFKSLESVYDRGERWRKVNDGQS